MENKEHQIIDLRKIASTLWSNKRKFFKLWACTFVLACIWILPQPRYYTSEVKLAPEINGEEIGGGLSSIASSFGINIGGISGSDAIYPELYPELFENPEFIVGLYGIQVITQDHEVQTDYFTYIKKHQKKNPITWPFLKFKTWLSGLFGKADATPRAGGANGVNPFQMNRDDYMLMLKIMSNITCGVDKKNSVVTITVKDQDPLVCATMADSVKVHLQDFIIKYRTSKAKEDVEHYQQMCDQAEQEYNVAMNAYSSFSDSHNNIILQSTRNELKKLEINMSQKQNVLSAMEAQLQASKVKLQEKTPAFTTLKSAIVPVKPAGPKRMIFVLMMLVFVSMVYACWLCRAEIFGFNR